MIKKIFINKPSLIIFISTLILGILTATSVPQQYFYEIFSSNWTSLIPQNLLLLTISFYILKFKRIKELIHIRKMDWKVFGNLVTLVTLIIISYYVSMLITYHFIGTIFGVNLKSVSLILILARLGILIISGITITYSFFAKKPTYFIASALVFTFLYHYIFEMYVLLPTLLGGKI